jgi:hypothetical protein
MKFLKRPQHFAALRRRLLRRWLSTAAAIALTMGGATGAVLHSEAAYAAGAITFDDSPGTSAPASTLGPYSMTPFSADAQAFGTVSSVSAPGGASVAFAPDVDHVQVGNGWATWSNGYAGDVYWTNGATSVTMTMPAGTKAFYFYAEPDPFATFDITATTQDGSSSGVIPVDGFAGASYFGFYASGSSSLETITVTSSVDFAIGEFGISQSASPQATILFLHGVDESYKDSLFAPLFQHIKDAVPGVSITHFEYFQDKADKAQSGGGCDAAADGQHAVALPSNLAGLPVDTSQNSPARCDSEGDIGQNAIRLDREIQDLYRQKGVKVILVGYSMGGETIRAFLSYSTQASDGVASGMVDSVVLLHGVEQGSWVAAAGGAVTSGASLVTENPFVGTAVSSLIGLFAPNPNRLATQEFNPFGGFIKWTDSQSTKLPDLPYYNTWGDERIVIHHCYLPFGHGCINTDVAHWGDMVLLPGSDNPTQTPLGGGERFLPNGFATNRWEWAEPYQVNWNPLTDPIQIGALSSLVGAPQQHTNYPNKQDSVTVADCRNGESVSVDTEIARVIVARLQGNLYACDLSQAKS